LDTGKRYLSAGLECVAVLSRTEFVGAALSAESLLHCVTCSKLSPVPSAMDCALGLVLLNGCAGLRTQ